MNKFIFAIIGIISLYAIGCGKTGGPSAPPPLVATVTGVTPGPTTPQPTATPEGPYIEITRPDNSSSFLSTDEIRCEAIIHNAEGIINWSITGYYFYGYDPIDSYEETSSPIILRPNLPIELSGRGDAVWYDIYAYFNNKGINVEDYIFIVQDEIDQCRQEYIDIQREGATIWSVPSRNEFSNDKNATYFTFNEFNWGYYTYAIITDVLIDNLDETREQFGRVMITTSGYRNPMKNERTAGSVLNSQHIYGTAVDIQLQDWNGDGIISKLDWDILYQIAHDNGACIEPYSLTPTWIHMDWRTNYPCSW